MSADAVVVTNETSRPVVIRRAEEIDRTMGHLDFCASRCVEWLLNAYAQVITDKPTIKLNAAKGRVAALRRECDGEPISGATSDDWRQAYERVDKLFARVYTPRKGRYDGHCVRRRA